MKKVITYGTFDFFHKGHRSIIERAKAMGDYLIVAVTGENYDHERGKLNVHDSLLTRIENVRNTGLADEIIVEEYQGQKLGDIAKYDIDVLVVGSDWTGKFDYLKRYCDVVYLERTKDVSSTQLREKNSDLHRIGIITDSPCDGDIISESRFVSGLDVVSVFAENGDEAADFREKYELGVSYGNEELAAFFDASDIVYVHTARQDRFAYAKQAIENNKHVILDFPVSGRREMATLFDLAEANGVIVSVRIPLAHLRTFQQLLSLVHAGLIGHVLRIDCAMPLSASLEDAAATCLFVFTKLLGSAVETLRCDHVQSLVRTAQRGEDAVVTLDRITAIYPERIATAEISTSEWTESSMHILGTRGRIEVPDRWWNMAYFRADIQGEEGPKRYSINTEGPGFRYLLLDLLLMITEGRTEEARLSNEESLKLMEILEGAGLL
jgi:glycerol-3-phosphate cytidylyltransferase